MPAPPQPILPQRTTAAVQPRAGGAFAVPPNFVLKPRGTGQPLPASIQQRMEALFNTKFDDVRIHVGEEAQAIGALAFTHGTDLYFAPGQYNPQSIHGQQLLGHELTHVMQQRAGRVRNPLGMGVAVVQDPALEAEAERMGMQAARVSVPVQAKKTGLGTPLAPVLATSCRPVTAGGNAARPPLPDSVQRAPGPLLPRNASAFRPTATERHPLSQSAAAQTKGGHPFQNVVQRNIGFEYETTSDTYSATPALTNHERQQFNIPARAVALHKGDVLVGNIGGLHLKADLGGAGVGSDLEFETDAFPETPAGRAALSRALKNLERICNFLNSKAAAGTHHLRNTHLAQAFGGNTPATDRYIRATGAITGNPQASVGVRLEKIEELMELTVGGPTGGPNALPANPTLARLELGSQADFDVVGDAPRMVRQGITDYVNTFGLANPFPLINFPSDKLVGFCSLILTYLIKGSIGQQYAKQIAPLMARTDFGSMFTTDLPAPEQAHLSHNNGAEFLSMWRRIIAHANLVNPANVPGGIAGQLFQHEPHAVRRRRLRISRSLTRRRWLREISQGNDLLTSASFPAAAARPQLFGLGGKGAQHDTVDPTGANLQAPIFELRRIRKSVTPHYFAEMAMGIFDYIIALNAGAANPQYNPVARNPKHPKNLQKLLYEVAAF
jgi:hypothetical protein